MAVVEPPPRSVEPPARSPGPRAPWAAVALAVGLPGVYLGYWHASVRADLERARPHWLRTVGWTLAGTVGWLLIVPAAVQIVHTARRVQRCEASRLGAAQPVGRVLGLLAAAELLGVALALAGAPGLVPVCVLLAGAAAVGMLHPRVDALRGATDGTPSPAGAAQAPEMLPILPARARPLARALTRWSEDLEAVVWFAGLAAAAALIVPLVYALAAVDRTGLPAAVVTAVLLCGLVVGASLGLGHALRQLEAGAAARWWAGRGEPDRALAAIAVLGVAAAVPWLWSARPLFHGLLMPLYQWPLVTWIPLALGLAFVAACALATGAAGRGARSGLRAGISWRGSVTFAIWLVFMALLPSLQGRALYEASVYTAGTLPDSTQPRVLPKAAAESFAADASLHDAHLVVDPFSRDLVWSGEREAHALTSRASDDVLAQPLDRVDGTMESVARGFTPPVSRVMVRSLQWRAYDRHWSTRVQDAVIVPLGGSSAVALAPYVGYRGFPVRHPYWAGVYVYHQDGRMEDLSPRQAMARPELAKSGRLFPEALARDTAEAYGYRTGAGAAIDDDTRTAIGDPSGNPQPYLTNLGDGRVRWVTVAHPGDDRSTISAVFLTDSSTGATQVWRPPHGRRLLSNTGAADLVRRLPLKWTGCCDSDDNDYWLRKVVEPTPVFSRGRLYYVASVVANQEYLPTAEPVDETVVVDAARARIVQRYDDADPDAQDALRRFFRGVD